MPHPASPSASLFASDYSLSPHPSPPVRYPSPNPSVLNRRTNDGTYTRSSLASPDAIPLHPLGGTGTGSASGFSYRPSALPLPVVFPQPQAKSDGVFLSQPLSPGTISPGELPLHSLSLGSGGGGVALAGVGIDNLTRAPGTKPSPMQRRLSRQTSMRKDSSAHTFGTGDGKGGSNEMDDLTEAGLGGEEDVLDGVPVLLHHSVQAQRPERPSLQKQAHSLSSSAFAATSPAGSSRRSSAAYRDFQSCMEGGIGHETKSASYKPGTEKAYHHLQRSLDLFSQALLLRPNYPKGMLAKSKVLITLGMNYQPPRVAALSLREAVKMLRELVRMAPKSVSARETLAQACALLCGMLAETETEDAAATAAAAAAGLAGLGIGAVQADDEAKMWEGAVGSLAREALAQLEDVAADKMDKMRAMSQKEAAEAAPGMAEMFLALSSAAITVSTLAVDLPTVDLHIELAEQALDQASNMSTVAASARVKSSTSSANLITRVQLASGRSSLERLRHTFILGNELDEDDFRSLMADMSMLATECRERAVKLKGSKAAASSTLAWEAIKQLGDAKVLYASLLRLVWRKRRPGQKRRGTGGLGETGRKLSQRSGNGEEAIQEEDEGEEKEGSVVKGSVSRETRGSGGSVSLRGSGSRKGSNLGSLKEHVEVSTFNDGKLTPGRPSMGSRSGSIVSLLPSPNGAFGSTPPSFSRRGSWLPDQSPLGGRTRRQSSMSASLVGPDGISAWTRKASVISLGLNAEEEASGLVSSAELAGSAWQLLEGAVKQYKLALTLLSSSDLPSAQMAKGKAETLSQIAYASWFQASLAPRLAVAADKRTSLLVTAEVYSTWAAREVGWSFLIEGTKEAALADRRTNSWKADEAGKRAVMLLLRVWWYRAVTTESMDTDTKSAAKDAVEVVVRRMRDKEGVRDGDVARWRAALGRGEGEMDAAEALFWRSVSRILRGGAGFVMS